MLNYKATYVCDHIVYGDCFMFRRGSGIFKGSTGKDNLVSGSLLVKRLSKISTINTKNNN